MSAILVYLGLARKVGPTKRDTATKHACAIRYVLWPKLMRLRWLCMHFRRWISSR